MRKHLLLLVGSFLLFFSCHKSDTLSKSDADETLDKLIADIPKAIYLDGAKKTITIVKRNGEKVVVPDVYANGNAGLKPTIGSKDQFSLSFLPFGSGFKGSKANARAAVDGTEGSGGGGGGATVPGSLPGIGMLETVFTAQGVKAAGKYIGATGYFAACFPAQGSFVDQYGNTVVFTATCNSTTGSFLVNPSGLAIHVWWLTTQTVGITVSNNTKITSTEVHANAWFF